MPSQKLCIDARNTQKGIKLKTIQGLSNGSNVILTTVGFDPSAVKGTDPTKQDISVVQNGASKFLVFAAGESIPCGSEPFGVNIPPCINAAPTLTGAAKIVDANVRAGTGFSLFGDVQVRTSTGRLYEFFKDSDLRLKGRFSDDDFATPGTLFTVDVAEYDFVNAAIDGADNIYIFAKKVSGGTLDAWILTSVNTTPVVVAQGTQSNLSIPSTAITHKPIAFEIGPDNFLHVIWATSSGPQYMMSNTASPSTLAKVLNPGSTWQIFRGGPDDSDPLPGGSSSDRWCELLLNATGKVLAVIAKSGTGTSGTLTVLQKLDNVLWSTATTVFTVSGSGGILGNDPANPDNVLLAYSPNGRATVDVIVSTNFGTTFGAVETMSATFGQTAGNVGFFGGSFYICAASRNNLFRRTAFNTFIDEVGYANLGLSPRFLSMRVATFHFNTPTCQDIVWLTSATFGAVDVAYRKRTHIGGIFSTNKELVIALRDSFGVDVATDCPQLATDMGI